MDVKDFRFLVQLFSKETFTIFFVRNSAIKKRNLLLTNSSIKKKKKYMISMVIIKVSIRTVE